MPNPIDDELFKRMVLANQYRILAALYPDEAAEWRRAETVITRNWPIADLPDAEQMRSSMESGIDPDDAKMIYDALDLFGYLQTAAELGTIDEGEFGSLAFPGFDGNSETRFLGYYRSIVSGGQVFTYVKKAPDLNSHLPMVERYRSMIEKWEGKGRPQVIDADLARAIWNSRGY